jgi:hypothetical protein
MRMLKLGCVIVGILFIGFVILVGIVAVSNPPSSSRITAAESPSSPEQAPHAQAESVKEDEEIERQSAGSGLVDASPQIDKNKDASYWNSEEARRESERLRSLDDYPDMFMIMQRASVGEQDIDTLQGSYVQGNEAYEVESILESFVIYRLRQDLQSTVHNSYRVALVREARKTYLTGSLMARDVYTLRGTQEFISAMGSREMLPVFERGRR